MKSKITITFILFLLIILIFPFKKILVPQWNLKIVDESHIPIADVIVENSWTNYSFPYGENRIRLLTNLNGDVSFPEAYIYTSLGCEVIRFVIELNPLRILPHYGDAGAKTSVSTSGENNIYLEPTREKVDLPNIFVVNRKSAQETTDYLRRINENK